MDEKKEILFLKNNNDKSKLNLCYYSTLRHPDENYINDPIIKLLCSFEEIQYILSIYNSDFFKFLYFNRIKINEILFESQKNLIINEINNTINNYFYLALLLHEDSTMINYIYSINLIKNINQLQTKEKKQKIKLIILAKLMLELIKNYEQIQESEDNLDENYDEQKLLKIKEYTETEIIDKNIEDLKEFNIQKEDIYSKKIDYIYVQIINYLIINKKLDDSEDTSNIISQLDLQNINITNDIFKDLEKLLIKEKDYIKEFIISKYEDLFDEKKITFYYMLFKYILKSNYYIYKIPFLKEIKNNILRNINENLKEFYSFKKYKSNYKYKIEYILNYFIIDFKYYIKKYSKKLQELSNIHFSKDSEISKSSSNTSNLHYFSRESVIEEKAKNNQKDFTNDEEEPKYDYEKLVEMCENEKAFKILENSTFFLRVKKENDDTIIEYDKIIINGKEEININLVKSLNSEHDLLNYNYKKFVAILNQIENKLKKEVEINIDFSLEIKFENINKKLKKDFVFTINCTYFLTLPNTINKLSYIDENILVNGLNDGISYVISDINTFNDSNNVH